MELVVRQISGLGNQLFQYAAGIFYAQQYGASMRVAIDPPQVSFSYGYARPFLLSHFNIPVPLQPLNRQDRLVFTTKPWLRPASHAWRKLHRIQIVRESLEQRYRFQPTLPVAGAEIVYLFGYWQTWPLVEAVQPQLRRDFSFREPATGKNVEVLQRIRDREYPVSLHIRRGDYTLAAEGNIALPLEYYLKAIDILRQCRDRPTFFVFSDDIPWARAHLPADLSAVFIDHNGDTAAHEDLRLMSACRDHIIANSSFSWWGAWLNPRADKIVVAPKHWLRTPESFFPDLLPTGWILIDSLREAPTPVLQ
jgi:hypothetical protein